MHDRTGSVRTSGHSGRPVHAVVGARRRVAHAGSNCLAGPDRATGAGRAGRGEKSAQPIRIVQSTLRNAVNHSFRRIFTLVAPASDRLNRYPARAMRCDGWYNHVLRHHHVLGRDRDPRPVHAVTTATGEEAGYGRDVHPVTETTGRRSCGASGDTGLPAAGSPAVGVLTRCTLAGRGLGSGPPPPPRTTRRGPWRHPSRSRAISRLR